MIPNSRTFGPYSKLHHYSNLYERLINVYKNNGWNDGMCKPHDSELFREYRLCISKSYSSKYRVIYNMEKTRCWDKDKIINKIVAIMKPEIRKK